MSGGLSRHPGVTKVEVCVCVCVCMSKNRLQHSIPFSSKWCYLFLRISPTHYQVAEALISGISAGFLEGATIEAQEEGGRIHFNFAFDENVFKNAYNLLRAR